MVTVYTKLVNVNVIALVIVRPQYKASITLLISQYYGCTVRPWLTCEMPAVYYLRRVLEDA